MTRGRLSGVALACVLSSAAALPGCSNVIKEHRTTTITSDPTGATVLASGVEIGVTPLTIRPDEAFPPRFVGFEYRAAGTLMLKKDGCKPYSQQVDDAVLSKTIHVNLDCDPSYQAPQPAAGPAPHMQSPAMREDFAARLRRLDDLKKQGLISEQEYQQLRRKILNEL